MLTRTRNYIKQNRLEAILVGLIIVIALFLRLYRINEYMTFLGDEGRDVRIVRDLLRGNLVFIGPQTSIGNMYLGPLYYYLIAPSLFLSRLNPVGPAIFNALLGTLTVFLTYLFGKNWFGKQAGLLAALLFAVSPVAIIYSRSSWNPNPMPLFALISIWGIGEVWQKKSFKWLPWVGVAFALALQMHYLGLLLFPVIFLLWFFTYQKNKGDKTTTAVFFKKTLWGVILFLVLMSPLLLFDIKHQGQNLGAFRAFFADRQTTINLNPARSDRYLPAVQSVVSELLLGRELSYSIQAALIIFVISLWALYALSRHRNALKLTLVWIFFGILGLGIYKQHVYAHYFGFLFPAVYILAGFELNFLWTKKFPFKALSIVLLFFLLYLSVFNSPLRFSPNRQLQRTEAAVDLIIKESSGLPFNFGLIAKQNYDESYRYFFENKKAALVRSEDGITDQLYVICEDGETCAPEGHSQYQIAMFGAAKVSDEWRLDHLRIYRLIHPQ